MAKQETVVKEVSNEELTALLDHPGADNGIVIITDPTKTESVLTDKNKVVESQLNDPPLSEEEKAKLLEEEKNLSEEEKQKKAAAKKAEEEAAGAEIISNLNKNDGEETEEEEEEEGAATAGKGKGRPREDKNMMVEVLGELIKDETIIPFEDKEDLSKYSKQEVVDLFKANLKERDEKMLTGIQDQFFETLSPTLKHLADFEYKGGKNLSSILEAMLRVEKNATLDPENEKDQESITRNFLHVTNFGTPEEIEAEITLYKDSNVLDKKAKQFKPKLDARHAEQVQQEVTRQEEFKKQQQVQMETYTKNIAGIIQKGDLNGIKLDKKTQELLFVGATAANYTTRNGVRTNYLGHLLEKHQSIEPNHALVLEAIWLMHDPEGYKAKVRENAIKDKGEETFRKLKDSEKSKATGGGGQGDDKGDDAAKTGAKKGIKKQTDLGFLSRLT